MYVTRFVFLFLHQWTLELLSPFRCCCYECDCTNSPLCPASDSLGYVPRSVTGFCVIVDSFLCWESLLSSLSFWYFICESSALAHGSVCVLMMDFVTTWTAITELMPVFVQPALSLEFESERSLFSLNVSTNVPWLWQVPLSLGASFSTSPPMRKYN